MLLIRLLNLIKGCVTIVVEGAFPERFLNICARRGIYLWNVKRQDSLRVSANVSIKGFKMLRPIAKKTHCRVYIKKRSGMPFHLHKHRKRKLFAAGMLFFVAALFVLTRFIWVIDVAGNNDIAAEQITNVLFEAGLRPGTPNSKVDILYLQNFAMTKLEKIAWIGINIKGTTAFVEIKERILKPEIFQKDTPCNIVAKNDGVIELIDAVNGNRLVNAGDVVSKGQLLISGVIDSQIGEGVRYLHADGEVLATTWREISVDIPQFEEIRTRTGRSKSKHGLKIFNFYVNFFLNDRISYANYDRISYVKNFSIGKSFALPVSFHYDNYYEIDVTQREYDKTEAIALAEGEAFEHVKGLQIKNSYKLVEGNKLKMTYECLENIVEKKAILREDAKDGGEGSGGGID
ncbi:MAG: sporulation protein YqfD [Firmicutes bacterium]|nr:sporulation protein YqfD [Bacillota bacterium]